MAKALPRAIQKSIDEAEAVYKQAVVADPDPAKVIDPEAQPALEQPDPQTPPVAGAETPPAVQPEPVTPPDTSDEAKWEQRYKTLQGMHNQNMSDIKRRLKEATDANQALQAQMQELAAQRIKEPVVIDPKFADEFGEDLVAMVESITKAYLDRTQLENESRIKQLDDRVRNATSAAAKTAEDLFFEQLTLKVPDWKEINVQPEFLEWLAEDDPIYGITRQAALNTAGEQRDVARVSRIFKEFAGGVAGRPEPKPNEAKTQLEKQVAPPAGRAAPLPTARPDANTRIISSAEVTKFYDDVRRGVYRGREADMQKLEQEINRALSEGRITP